jgi:hypothetical protein
VVVGLASWALFALQSGREKHSYAHGGPPPAFARLVAGHEYAVSVPGGTSALRAGGVDPSTLQCSATPAGGTAVAVAISAESSQKALNQIATFNAPGSGDYRITCTGVGAVYVDDAADAGFDWSGLWLVLASAALVVGLPVTLAGLRRPTQDDADQSVGLVGSAGDDE